MRLFAGKRARRPWPPLNRIKKQEARIKGITHDYPFSFMKREIKIKMRVRRHKRVRARIKGTSRSPRLSVFRSNRHLSAQLVDDESGNTLCAASDLEIKGKRGLRMTEAGRVGELIAQKATALGIRAAVFDRGGYRYHGVIKALADGARQGGLKF